MEQFEYLLVIIGIILGLALTHILQGFVEYLQHRDHIVWSRAQLVWMVALFLLQVQYWYVMFEVGQAGANFGRYLGALIFPTCLYLATGVLVPRISAEAPGPTTLNLRDKYHANRKWFFGLCILGMISLVFYDQLVLGTPWSDIGDTVFREDNKFRLIGLGLLVLLFFVGGWVHGFLTFLAVLTLVAFIVMKTMGLSL